MNKTMRLALVSLIFNIAFAVYHIVFGVISRSYWLFTIGVYYVILVGVRFTVIGTKRRGDFITRFAGGMLMLLSLPLVGTVILAVVRDRGIVMHEIVMITMAMYYFTKITLAIINLINARKSASARVLALRNVSLANACVSVFALQRSMLVSFGDMSEYDISVFNAVVGAAVCVIVFLLGIGLFRNRTISLDDPGAKSQKHINSDCK